MDGRHTDSTLATQDRLVRLTKFATVGAAAFAVNLLVFAALDGTTWYLVAGAVSWLVANFSSYNLNRRFTFEEIRFGYLRGYRRHLSVYLVGFVVYMVVLWLLGTVVDRYVALVCAVVVSGSLNFVGSEFWVFDPGR
ncbi:GtrA family protein [Halobium salinum]|uniref:GtrA family protein n=1 Tax=Halobium salinum TaxID=1364940 RepID=A0ABD5PG88_9EURY|nr:GtrA family protein [Halobium salinum]